MTIQRAMYSFIDYLRNERAVKKSTMWSYKDALLNKFREWIANDELELTDITLEQVNQFRGFLTRIENKSSSKKSDNLQSCTIEVIMCMIRSFFRYLKTKDLISFDPQLILIKPIRYRPRYALNDDEILKLLSTPSLSTPNGLRDSALLEVFFSTGLRRSEVWALDKNVIDLERGEFSIKGKGDKIRTVYLSKRAIEAIERYLAIRTDTHPALFLNLITLTRLSKPTIRNIVARYGLEAGIQKNVHPHLLRHSFATHLINSNVNIREVQAFMGHSDLRTTANYLNLVNPRLHEVHTKAMNL